MYVLGGLAVERKKVVRSNLYSLSAGSKHSTNCQDPHKAFGRGPMTPTVVGVGLVPTWRRMHRFRFRRHQLAGVEITVTGGRGEDPGGAVGAPP